MAFGVEPIPTDGKSIVGAILLEIACMTARLDAVATWAGALTRGGLLFSNHEERGVRMAVVLVGEARLADLRAWFESLSEAHRLEIREAVIAFALHMLVADAVCSNEEAAFLEDLFDSCEVLGEARARLRQLTFLAMTDRRKLPHPETIAETCDHPVLREILLAIGWHVILADQRTHDDELALWERIVGIFSIDDARAKEIAETVAAYRAP